MILVNVALILLLKTLHIDFFFSFHILLLLIKSFEVLCFDLIDFQSHNLLLFFMLTLQIEDFLIFVFNFIVKFRLNWSIPLVWRLKFSLQILDLFFFDWNLPLENSDFSFKMYFLLRQLIFEWSNLIFKILYIYPFLRSFESTHHFLVHSFLSFESFCNVISFHFKMINLLHQ